MSFIIKKIFLLIILIFLQSCSGGRIGNFLESSFKNIDETKINEDNKSNITRKVVSKSERYEQKNNIDRTIIKENINNNFPSKKVSNSEEVFKNDQKNFNTADKSKNYKIINKQKISQKKRQFQPQSYKIIFILKNVDPKDPIEDLSTILRNSDVNFEIEKIERFFDSKKKL